MRIHPFVHSAVLVAILGSASALGVDARCIAHMKAALTGSEFVTSRDLGTYRLMLGEEFKERYDGMPDGAPLMDLGGGDGVAAKEMSAQNRRVTLVAYAAKEPQLPGPGYRPLYGRFFEDIPDRELLVFGRPKIAVDVWGVLAYTSRPGEALAKIHSLLPDDGELFLVVGSRHPKKTESISGMSGRLKVKRDSSLFSSEVILKDGTQVPFPEYLRAHLKGFDVTETTESSIGAFRLRKNGETFRFPKLEYLGDSSDPALYPKFTVFADPLQKPPAKLYREID